MARESRATIGPIKIEYGDRRIVEKAPDPRSRGMSPDAIQQRFIDEINQRGSDDKYIDKNEEREILQIAIHHGIGAEAGRTALSEVCAKHGYLLESELTSAIKSQCDAAIANGGKIDLANYEAILNGLRTTVGGRRDERELMKLIVTVIEDNDLKVKSGRFFNWYKGVKRQVGSG